MKNGKISLKRTFPRKYGVVNLVWTVRDCDGTDFGCQPGLAAQAKRLLFRAKALRDLQALLMADLNAGGSLPKVQHAFYFMCWLIPLTEERFDLPSTLDSELCSKQGWPLQGFSDVSAADVWAEMPSILRASVGHLSRQCDIRLCKVHEQCTYNNSIVLCRYYTGLMQNIQQRQQVGGITCANM